MPKSATPPYTVCFTGRRPKDLCGYDLQKYVHFHQQLLSFVHQLYQMGFRTFITGGAQGFDQMVFRAVYEMNKNYHYKDVRNKIYIPFAGQEDRWAEKGLFSKEEYQDLLTKAHEVHIISPQNSVKAMFLRNEAMVDDADLCIGLYPDEHWRTASHGGTASCMQYAEKQDVPVWRIAYETNPKLNITGVINETKNPTA